MLSTRFTRLVFLPTHGQSFKSLDRAATPKSPKQVDVFQQNIHCVELDGVAILAGLRNKQHILSVCCFSLLQKYHLENRRTGKSLSFKAQDCLDQIARSPHLQGTPGQNSPPPSRADDIPRG